jgi:drug/metabolite transporter (DMT)-like permease
MSVPYDETVMTATERPDTGGNRAGTGNRRPVLTAVLGAACISSSAILVTLAHVGDVTTAFFRCALALPILVPLAMLEQRRLGPRPLSSRRNALLAGLFLAVDLVLWNHAIADVGAGVATVLGNLQVLFVAAFAWLVLRERPGKRYLLMLPVVLAGVVLVSGVLGGHAAGLHPLAGALFGLATSAAYACFLLTLRSTAGHTPHVAGQLADATVGAAVGAVVLGLLFGGFQLAISWPSFGWLLMLAVLSGTAGWLLITSSLPRLPAAMSSLLLLLQPAGALVLAAVVLREQPTTVQIAGALLVCLGVLAASWTRTSRGPGQWRERVPAAESQANHPPGASSSLSVGGAGGTELAADFPARFLLITRAAASIVWMP